MANEIIDNAKERMNSSLNTWRQTDNLSIKV